jgi:hypothetical protein
MKGLLFALSGLFVSAPIGYAPLVYTPMALAAESWVEVLVNPAGDRILVDQNSIQRKDNEVRYWEYRDRRQAQNRGAEQADNQPVYGMMIYRSVDCASGTNRMQRLVLFNQNQQVIRRVNYESTGGLSQPSQSSDTEAVVKYVCEGKDQQG